MKTQGCLVERVGVEEPRRQVDAFARIDVDAKAGECCFAPGDPQAVALEGEPTRPPFALIVVESCKQLAAVQWKRVGDTVFTQGRLEGEHIGLGFEAQSAT